MSSPDRIQVLDSEEEEDDPDLPSREECEERCQSFAEITGTDTALAMFYLQDRKWILQTALNDYFQSKHGNGDCPPPIDKADEISKVPHSAPNTSTATSLPSFPSDSASSLSSTSQDCMKSSSKADLVSLLQPEKEGRVRVLSWNLDGLDPNNLDSRTEAACLTLNQENAEIVFLQEVVVKSFRRIQQNMPQYDCFVGMDNSEDIPFGAYFTVMLLRKNCSSVEQVNIAAFPKSQMDRTLLEVKCQVKGVPMTLLTSHLESTAEFSDERKRQLKMAFDRLKSQPGERTVIFGGDLNLRDKELIGESSKPDKVYDLWECTGKRPEAKFTWDLTINDNKQVSMKFQPRCRFDRLYIRHPKDGPVKLKPVYFEITGIQRLRSCRRFTSDHWAILAHLDVKPST